MSEHDESIEAKIELLESKIHDLETLLTSPDYVRVLAEKVHGRLKHDDDSVLGAGSDYRTASTYSAFSPS